MVPWVQALAARMILKPTCWKGEATSVSPLWPPHTCYNMSKLLFLLLYNQNSVRFPNPSKGAMTLFEETNYKKTSIRFSGRGVI